jgi:hypothetical protein
MPLSSQYSAYFRVKVNQKIQKRAAFGRPFYLQIYFGKIIQLSRLASITSPTVQNLAACLNLALLISPHRDYAAFSEKWIAVIKFRKSTSPSTRSSEFEVNGIK